MSRPLKSQENRLFKVLLDVAPVFPLDVYLEVHLEVPTSSDHASYQPIQGLSDMLDPFRAQNKHCEILVSCSDKERNCIQVHRTACKLMVLQAHVMPWNLGKP